MNFRGSGGPPRNWDQLSDIDVDDIEPEVLSPQDFDSATTGEPSWSARLATAWADLVIVAGLTTAMIGTVILLGYPLSIRALPWAAGVALLGWAAVCGIILRVRRCTPGMVMAGLVFTDEIAGARLASTIAAAGFSALFLGLPALPGSRGSSLLSIASGSALGLGPEARQP